jgi:hypothetical protein
VSGFWVGVYQNVIANLVIAVAAWLVLVAALISLNVLRRRGQFRFFGLTKVAPRLTCYTSTVNVKQWGSAGPGGVLASFFGPAVPSYETDALVPFVVLWDSGRLDRLPSRLRERLQKWWIIRNVQPEIRPSPESAGLLVHGGSIVSVGSRAYNSCTAYLHDVLGTELSIGDGLAVLRATPERLFEWRYAGPPDAEDETDFAIVERRSVRQTSTTYFVAAGLTTTGTTGAVAFLAKFWKDLYRVYGRSDFAICLMFNDVSSDPIAHLKPDVVYCTPWRRIHRVSHRRRASLGRMGLPSSAGSGDAGYTRQGLPQATEDDTGSPT